jgi:REP element-mobilizing transposase RayT
MHGKDAIHFVTNRCEQEQFLMLPSKRINHIIGYWFTRSLYRYGYGLEIFAFIFLSNHFHLLVRDTQGTLSQFMCYFQGNVAKAINRELGRKGKFWAREYDDVLIDDQSNEDFLDRYTYILCNSVKAGLVTSADSWIGWSSLDAALTGEKLSFSGINKTKKHHATRRGQKIDDIEFLETYEFELALPPMWEHFQIAERATFIRDLLKGGERKFNQDRGNKPALGIGMVLKQKWSDRPKKPSFRPRIKIFCSNYERRKELLNQYRSFTNIYREMYGGYLNAIQKGKRPSIEWPDWSFPPSTMVPVFPGLEMAAS